MNNDGMKRGNKRRKRISKRRKDRGQRWGRGKCCWSRRKERRRGFEEKRNEAKRKIMKITRRGEKI